MLYTLLRVGSFFMTQGNCFYIVIDVITRTLAFGKKLGLGEIISDLLSLGSCLIAWGPLMDDLKKYLGTLGSVSVILCYNHSTKSRILLANYAFSFSFLKFRWKNDLNFLETMLLVDYLCCNLSIIHFFER